MFGGRLTLLAGGPVIDRDVTSSTLYYAPYTGNTANGITFTSGSHDAVGLSLSLSGVAAGVYDVFISSAPALVLGGRWANYGNGSYGSGKYCDPRRTSPLVRTNGILTDIDGNAFLGTIAVDDGGGTCTAHVTYGLDRKYGVWNAYNREPLCLSAGVPSGGKYSVTTAIPSWGMVAGNSGNNLSLVTGAPQRIRLELQMARCIRAGNTAADTNGQHQFAIGWNHSTPDSTWSGYTLELYSLPSTEALNVGISSSVHFDTQPFTGCGKAYALENGHGTCFSWSGLRDMALTAKWMG